MLDYSIKVILVVEFLEIFIQIHHELENAKIISYTCKDLRGKEDLGATYLADCFHRLQ